jgi:hypothetical protein
MSLIRGLPEIGLKAAKKKPFYSAVDETLANLKRNKGTGIEFLTEVMKTKGVKPAEIADRKLEQAFKGKGKMTKQEAQQVLKENPPPQVEDRHLREISDYERDKMLEEKLETSGYDYMGEVPAKKLRQWNDEIDQDLEKYGDYKTAGGQNYREILLKLPQAFTNKEASRIMALEADLRRGEIPENQMQELIALKNKQLTAQPDYRTSHWNEDPNVLAHMRVQDRKGPNGEKILHVEEIQSDWHQAGRKKGYGPKLEEQYRAYYTTPDGQQVDIGFGKTPAEVERMTQAAGWDTMPVKIETEKTVRQIGEGVPDAPFKKNWHELAMKRLLNYAAENDYDSIAITPGAEQAKRYSLSKQLDEVIFDPNTGHLSGRDHNGKLVVAQKGVTTENLPDYIGKEGAQKILESPLDESGVHALRGADLEVGGEGMKGFYDKMLPDYLNTFGKPYGAQIQMNSTPVSTRDPKSTSWGAGMPGDHPFITVQDLNEPFDGMVELMRRNADTGEETLVGRMTRPESERLMAEELKKLDTFNQIKLHNFPITPEMRESIKTKGLPLYQQVGIPTAGAGAASQMLEPQEEPEYSKGGSIAKMAALAKLKQMRGEMAPRAEAVKNIIARDENRYLADVVPNSLTNAEIEAEIKRMAAKAPMIMKPSTLTELKKIVQQEKGGYGARRVERAADEIPNLENMYTLDALKERFLGDNAKALMTMSPADFEKFATELQGKTSVGPKAAESAKQGEISKYTVPTNEYVKHLERIAMFDSVPYLNLAKEEVGLPLLPYVSGHEGRHRSRALAGKGEKRNLVGVTPTMDLREGLPRRSQEEFIEAMKKELELSGGLVLPQSEPMMGGRPPIILPDVYAKGGSVKPQVKKSVSGKVKMSDNRDAMFMELSNKKLKRK